MRKRIDIETQVTENVLRAKTPEGMTVLLLQSMLEVLLDIRDELEFQSTK